MQNVKKISSPLHLFIITAASVFLIEAFVMLIFSNFPFLSIPVPVMILDALLHTVLIVPVIYFSIIRPMRRSIEERLRTEVGLQKAKSELEMKVLMRTTNEFTNIVFVLKTTLIAGYMKDRYQ